MIFNQIHILKDFLRFPHKFQLHKKVKYNLKYYLFFTDFIMDNLLTFW